LKKEKSLIRLSEISAGFEPGMKVGDGAVLRDIRERVHKVRKDR